MAHRGRSHKLKERYAYGQAKARRGRGMTLSPGRAVGPRSPSGGMTTRPGGGHPLPPKGVAAKSAHIVGSAFIPPGGKAEIHLVPKEYPYFTAHTANVTSNYDDKRGATASSKINIRAYVGAKPVQGLKVGFQKLNWPPGSTTGLAREVRVVIYNHGTVTAKVKIDLSVMPMDHL